jgi:hypothetical protein
MKTVMVIAVRSMLVCTGMLHGGGRRSFDRHRSET